MSDDLLDDLNDLGNNEEDVMQESSPSEMEEDSPDSPSEINKKLLEKLATSQDITQIAKLLSSNKFQSLLSSLSSHATLSHPLSPEEYSLIIEANNTTSDIDTDILLCNKYLRELYSKRFPELDQLVPSAIDFAKTVQLIGSGEIKDANLKGLLPNATVMIINVASTTTDGQPLSPSDLQKCLQAAQMILDLDAAKSKIHSYVESRMHLLAPNLTQILTPSTSAKLMGAAGGLSNLSHIAACNLIVIGKQQKGNSHLSILSQERHRGFIFYDDIIQAIPPEFRQKAVRIVGAKATLACRVDAGSSSPDGQIGRNLRAEVDKRLAKLLEPPPDRGVKALPAPKEGPKKRRGGRRIRKMKQQYVMTEVRKAANRMAFGEAVEVEFDGEDEVDFGMVGKSGHVRLQGTESNLQKFKKPKKPTKPIVKKPGNQTSGMATSIAFTPVQGIELSNPELLTQRDRLKQINAKWFSENSIKKEISGTQTASMLPPPRPT